MSRMTGLLALLAGCTLLLSPVRAEGAPDDEAKYLHRLERASEIYYNVGFLYVADGMNRMHDHGDRAATAAVLYRGAGFLKNARDLNRQAVNLARSDDSLKYEAPQADPAILQGTQAARDVLTRLETNYPLRWPAFHAALLKDTLDPEQDFIETIADAMRPVEGQFAGARLKELLEAGRDQSDDEREQYLKADALEAVAVAYWLDVANVSVPSTGDGGVFDTKRGEAPPAHSTAPAPDTATAISAATSSAVEVRHSFSAGPGHEVGASTRTATSTSVSTSVSTANVHRPPPHPPAPPTGGLAAAAQKAAEAAALAGAKVKDKQIAYAAALNWEMRRALKEFLFAYTVRFPAAAFPCVPVDETGAGPAYCPKRASADRYDFAWYDPRENSNETNGPFVPTVCPIYDPTNNYCMKAGAPGIPEFQGGGAWGTADPIIAAVNWSGVGAKSVATCEGRTLISEKAMLNLLLNVDPAVATDAVLDPFPSTITGLGRVGVLPRMALLSSRLDTLKSWLTLDLKASTGSYTVRATDQARLAAGGAMYDRTRAAYQAAVQSLTSSGLVGVTVELTEAPEKARPQPFLDDWTHVTVANAKFETRGQLDRGDCFVFRESRKIFHFPFGLNAGPDLFENYSVQVKVTSGTQQASAGAAATPAPVRIGPTVQSNDDFAGKVGTAKLSMNEQLNTLTSPWVLNPLIRADETSSNTGGFTRNDHLGYLHLAATSIVSSDFAYRLAGGMAPWELGKYSPPCTYKERGSTFTLPVPLSARGADLRQRVAAYLNVEPTSPVLTQFMSDDAISKLITFLGAQEQIEQLSIPDPLLSDQTLGLTFVRNKGKPFTVAADPNASVVFTREGNTGGVCTPDAALAR